MPSNTGRFIASIWSFLKHPVTALIVGGLISGFSSWYVSLYFFNRATPQQVADALRQGEKDGRLQGQLDAAEDYRKNLPRYLEQQYHDELKAQRDLGAREGQDVGYANGFTAGHKDGVAEGERAAAAASHDAGYTQGRQDGYQAALQDTAAQHKAADDWKIFADAVTKAGKSADALDKNPNTNSEKRFLESIGDLVESARILNAGYNAKSSAFDSIVEQIGKALGVKDYEQVRGLTIKLRDTLPAKKSQFFSPEKGMQEALDRLTKIDWPKP